MIKGNNIKFYHFQTKEIFESELKKGNITPDSLVFIKNESLIWTHNNYYGDLSEVFEIIVGLNENKADKVNALTPIFSDPGLDFDAGGNNVNCHGYVGTLENLGISEGTLLIDSIGVYVREGTASPNLDTKVWCRLLKKENNLWKVIAQSEESKSIGDFDQESLFTFKLKNVGPDSIIKTSEKIAITYVDAVDALPNSGIQLGFKSISKPGGLQSALVEASSGNSSWCPAFVFGYIPLSADLDEFVHKTGNETISGNKTFNSLTKFTSDISISGKSTITSGIDPGELKVFHDNTTKGFILRTRNNSESIFPLELLSTNGSSSYQYNFPTTSGNVAIGVGIGDKIYNTQLESGLINLGGDLILKAKEVSYSELKLMCDEKRLLPGQFYRIIDYITESADVETISEKKPFDLIVKAIDVDKLSEDVNACAPTEGRSYYGSSQVGLFPLTSSSINPLDWNEVTEISETISNSIVDYESNNNISFGKYKVVEGEFTVNVTGGSVKVVIAQRGSSKAISCCSVEVFDENQIVSSTYKVKTINTSEESINYFLTGLESNKTYKVKLKFIKVEEPGSINLFVEISDYSNPYYVGIDFSKWVLKYDINNNTEKYSWADTENGKGVIYYLKDEWNNECYYDFKNIKFKRTQEWRSNYPALSSNSEYNFSETEKYFYTFDYNGSDDSLNKGQYKCENNSIGKCMSGKQIQLNNTIFFGNGNSNNKLGENNKNNVFGYDTYNNIIGVNCQNNVFCQKFTYNDIKNGFKNNYCSGNYFRYNEVNHLFEGNTFKGYVTRCKFSSEFKNNTLSGLVYDSTFGNNVQNCNFNGIVGHSNLGNVLLNITNFPELYKVTISPNTLSSVDLTTVNDSVSGKPLSEALLNKLSGGNYSEESICLYKKPNTSGSYEYCINKQSTSISINSSENTSSQPQKLLTDISINEQVITKERFTGTVGDSSTPIYFNNGVPKSITNYPESNLTFGGKVVNDDLSPIDSATDGAFYNNRLSFMDPNDIVIEYSNDGGSTWLDYGKPDVEKSKLVTTGLRTIIYPGNKEKLQQPNSDLLRVTISAKYGELYFSGKKILIYVSTNYATGTKVILEKAACGSDLNYITVGEYEVKGWSGWNSIPFECRFGGADSQTSNVRKIRLTFTFSGIGTSAPADKGSSFGIYNIYYLGTTVWSSNRDVFLSKTGHMYTWDVNKNVSFPGKLYMNSEGTKSEVVAKSDLQKVATSGSYNDLKNTPTSIKNPYSLSFGSKSYDGSSSITLSASDLGLSSALKYCGVTTTNLSDGSTTNPITISGSSHTATTGCVVFVNGTDEEYVYNGSKWQKLGYHLDLSDYAKTSEIEKIYQPKGNYLEYTISDESLPKEVAINGFDDIYVERITVDHLAFKEGLGDLMPSSDGKDLEFGGDTLLSEYNYSNYVYTKEEVDDKIENPQISKIDFSNGYTLTPTSNGNSLQYDGCVILDDVNFTNFVYSKDESDEKYKPKQTAKTSPTASGNATAFIDTISQDANGVITATKKNIDLSSYAKTSELDDIYKVIEDNELKVAEGLTNLSNNKLDKSYLSSLSTNTHTHNFTGTSSTIQKTTTASVSVATGSHTHTIIPSGTVSSTFTGTSVTSNKSSATEEVASQSHTHTVIPLGNVTSTFSNNFGTNTGLQNIQVGSSSHQHTVTAEGSISSTFTGTSSDTNNSGPTISYSSGTLTITLGHSHSYTPFGNISSSFTGTEVYSSIPDDTISLNHTHGITGSGSVSSSFSGVSSDVLATTTAGVEVSSKDHTHTVTAEGTISSSFSGTSSSTNNISGTVGVASQDHTHSYTPSGTISSVN